MPPAVHALVLNYNGENWLRRCLESLLFCSYKPLHLVLLDNGSTDGSVALARSISPEVEIIENKANLGFCGAYNAAIQGALNAGADYIAFLNNDTYVEPEWLTRLVHVGESKPEIGILGPVQLVFDGCAYNSWTTSALARRLDFLRRLDEPGTSLPAEWVEGSCLVAKRQVFGSIGLLDPIFFAFFEDLDFCRRARVAGFEVVIVPSSKIHHSRHGSFSARPKFRDFLLVRNSMIYNCTDPAATLLGNLAGLLRNSAGHLKKSLFGGPGVGAWLRASGSLVALSPAIYRKWRADRTVTRALSPVA